MRREDPEPWAPEEGTPVEDVDEPSAILQHPNLEWKDAFVVAFEAAEQQPGQAHYCALATVVLPEDQGERRQGQVLKIIVLDVSTRKGLVASKRDAVELQRYLPYRLFAWRLRTAILR